MSKFSIKVLLLGICLFQNVYAQDPKDPCFIKRKTMMTYFSNGLANESEFSDKTNGHNHDHDDVLNSSAFEGLCSNDQVKLKRIVYSTFRIFLLDENNKPLDYENNQITGTLVDGVIRIANGATMGIRKEKQRLLISLPINTTFLSDPWRRDAKNKPFPIKLVNVDGKEMIVHVIANKFLDWGLLNSIGILTLDSPITDYAPFLEKSSIGLSFFDGEVMSNYGNMILDQEKPNSNLFYLSYETARDTTWSEELRFSFGPDKVFYEINNEEKDNKNKKGRKILGSSHWVSAYNRGGGIYNYNFILVGVDQGVSAYPEYSKLTEVLGPIPSEIFQ